MKKHSAANYETAIKRAIKIFWDTRSKQRKSTDKSSRSAVTAGKHLDVFLQLLSDIAVDVGIPAKCIYLKGNVLPGFFRATKTWDLLIINEQKHLIAAIELKSQVGSFGNNFNNRTEEALGNAVDLWTAYREHLFPQASPPWLGYFILVEQNQKSTKAVRNIEPHYPLRKEFLNTSYLDRYELLCRKLMLEKHYNAAAIMWTKDEQQFGDLDKELSLHAFIDAYIGFLYGKLKTF